MDGLTHKSEHAYQCAHTDWNASLYTEAWWGIDLGDYYRVTGIKIYNRERICKFVYVLIQCALKILLLAIAAFQ